MELRKIILLLPDNYLRSQHGSPEQHHRLVSRLRAIR